MASSATVDRQLVRNGTLILGALVVCGLAAVAGAAMVYANPPVEEVTRQTNAQQFGTESHTSAVVTGNTTLYEADERLEDMPVYFFAASPNLTVSVETTLPADRDVDVTQRLTLRMRATRNDMEFWRSQRVLTADSATVSDGTLRSNATVNMSAVRAEMAGKRAAVGGVGTIDTRLVLNVTYETDAYSGTLTANTPVVLAESAYWTDSSLSASRTHTMPVTEQVTRPPNLPLVGGLGALGVCLLGAAAVLGRRYRDLDPDVLETDVARSRYDEWISNGEIPTKSGKEYITTDSLEDLVDVAIDSGKRVIYDDDLDAYAVVEGDLVYYFTTSDDDVTDWFDV